MMLGVHVSGMRRLPEAFDEAARLGCDTMQIFARSPQRWREHALDPVIVDEFACKKKSSGIRPVFIHIPYLINLASPEPLLFKDSVAAYIEDIVEAASLRVEYIVTHMGSHKETGERPGIARLIRALNRILTKTARTSVGILLENTSGSGSWLGYTFAHQRLVLDGLKDTGRVGICLDTAHAFAAGYDLAREDGLKKLVADIDREVGLEFLQLIHLNDSKAACGSRRDLHEHIGKGRIGLEGFRRLVNHPALREVPMIMETPKDMPGADEKNIAVVRGLLK
jgi:deoxyribonuclease-4